MVTATELGFVSETISPADQAGVAEAVRAAHDARQPIYPLGGRTALDYGIAPTQVGLGLDITALANFVDYTPRDMTILVEAGVRMADLAATLAAEGQHLPIDVPRSQEATIGGVVATNWNGPRRYGHGTIRDYVIGIHAVDGRGVAFKGGGRVVKNVAGYDFCKLLTGSLGTLAVVTQLALKVKPLPERAATIVGNCSDLATAEKVLNGLAQLEAPPVAIDLLIGSAWAAQTASSPEARPQPPGRPQPAGGAMLAIRVEGSESEVAWLAERVQYKVWSGGGTAARVLSPQEADALWSRLVEFADRVAGDAPDDSPLVLKIAVRPSDVPSMIAELLSFDANCSIQSHAGNGIIYCRFARFAHSDLTSMLVGKLRPRAVQLGGSVVVLSSQLAGLTPHMIWGGRTEANVLMEHVKQKFDPHQILNPGRFVF